MQIVAVSGGFDPLHPGHIDMFMRASEVGFVLVFLNSDEWLTRKKGKPFMDFQARKKILESIKFVSHVVKADDADGTVIKSLEKFRPKFFANGGDRGSYNTPEVEICNKLGIRMLWGIQSPETSGLHSGDFLKSWVHFKAGG